MERRALQRRRELFERTKSEIAKRLRSACAGLRDEDFEALVARIATVNIKYSQRREIAWLSEARFN